MEMTLGHALRPFQPSLGRQPPCGDGWLVLQKGRTMRLMLADGMGHGTRAHHIVSDLCRGLAWIGQRSSTLIPLPDCMRALHHMLQQQGSQAQACVALLDVDLEHGLIRCLNVGNIQVHVHAPDQRLALLNLAGMVGGHLSQTLKVSELAVAPGTLLSLCSDGIESKRSRDCLLSIQQRGLHAALDLQEEAELLLDCSAKASDDASCVLVRLERSQP